MDATRHKVHVADGRSRHHAAVRIVPFKPHAPGFFELNRAWLAQHDLWEAPDAEELGDPQGTIVAAGGRIYIAERRGMVIGTCAAVPIEQGVMEIRRMAVDPEWQRLGIGRRLLTRCVGYARRQGATRIVLTSNSRLAGALRLYRRFGFHDAPMPQGVPYATADVYMELDFTPATLVLSTLSARS